IPVFQGMRDDIVGKPSFQHPCRIKNEQPQKVSNRLDFFSELVLYLTIIAFAEKPALWDQFQVDTAEDFFFMEKDFIDPEHSKAFEALNTLSDTICELAKTLKHYCQQTDIDLFLPLERILQKPQINTRRQVSTQQKAPTVPDKTFSNLISNIQNFSSSISLKKPHVAQEINIDRLVQNIQQAQFQASSNKKRPEKGIDQLIKIF
ncbi:MAG: hypothetical protein HQK75_18335, partial [Candidatus Magnetomorum sp.]|nr:hypothetical protein [Candidatus Magnetomorum sp.]